MGRPKREGAKILIDFYNLHDKLSIDEYIEKVTILQDEMMASPQLLPGASRLIKHLSAHNIPIAVATGSGRDLFELKTSCHKELFALFEHILCSDDPMLKRGKPHPDIFLLAAERFKVQPESKSNVLVFEGLCLET